LLRPGELKLGTARSRAKVEALKDLREVARD
jgi:hypothetical protein